MKMETTSLFLNFVRDLSEENLRRYLSLKQKREDYAEFVRWLKRQPDFTVQNLCINKNDIKNTMQLLNCLDYICAQNSKIVGFGSGLIGSLVLDVMNTYSDGVVDIGVISSAPVEYRYEVPGVHYYCSFIIENLK